MTGFALVGEIHVDFRPVHVRQATATPVKKICPLWEVRNFASLRKLFWVTEGPGFANLVGFTAESGFYDIANPFLSSDVATKANQQPEFPMVQTYSEPWRIERPFQFLGV